MQDPQFANVSSTLQQNLILFITSISNVSYSSLKIHLAAIKYQAEVHGYSIPNNSLHRLYLLLHGIKRSQGNRNKKPKRLPITPTLLKAMLKNLFNSSRSYIDKIMIRSAFLTAFFGFLRVSEYTSLHVRSFDPETTLTLQDLKIKNYNHKQVIEINIKSSKTDPFRSGALIKLTPNYTELCPVKALLHLIHHHPLKSGPLFTFNNNKYLTRRELSNIMKELLPNNISNISSHSFRIGAATTAAAAGFPRWLIQSLGRWSSDCFRDYLRIPNETLHNVSKLLSQMNVNSSAAYDPDNFS